MLSISTMTSMSALQGTGCRGDLCFDYVTQNKSLIPKVSSALVTSENYCFIMWGDREGLKGLSK